MFELLASLGSAALQFGALGFGWVLAVVLLAYFLRSLKSKDKELLQIKTQHINDSKLWSGKLEQLHNKQNELITDLTDKRIGDLKELVEDYNEVATSMVTSLDKLANSIKIKNRSTDK